MNTPPIQYRARLVPEVIVETKHGPVLSPTMNFSPSLEALKTWAEEVIKTAAPGSMVIIEHQQWIMDCQLIG